MTLRCCEVASLRKKMHKSSAQKKLRVSACMDWSLVYMLNSIGASILPCGESFEQLIGVAEQGDRSEALRNGWVLSGLQ